MLDRLSGRQTSIQRREDESLGRLPTATCDDSALGVFSASRIGAIFLDGQIASEWAADAEKLDPLRLPDMTGGVNPGDRRSLYYLVRALKPRNVLEIGTHIGSSTVSLALAAARNRAEGVEGMVTSVDVRDVNDLQTRPWEQYGVGRSPRQMMDAMACNDVVRFEVGSSIDVLERSGERYGMIFLDGSHDAVTVYAEIPLALKRLESPGLIVLHDYFPNGRQLWRGSRPILGPWMAVERFRTEGVRIAAVPFGELPWETKLGGCVTSLAVLSRS